MVQGRIKDRILLVTGNDRIEIDIRNALGDDFLVQRTLNKAGALGTLAYHHPGLIVSDFDTDNTDGLDLLKTIRNNAQTKFIPFITVISSNHTNKRISAIESGSDSIISYPFNPQEFMAVIRTNLKKFKEFYLISTTDELTRLHNRREFINKFNNEISLAPDHIMSLAIFDIDFFKKVNDLYGHPTGDIVLKALAKLLKEKTGPSFFPARFGGEEFVILFPGTSIKKAQEEVEKLLNDFSEIEFKKNNVSFHVTFSAGLAEYPGMAKTISELLSRSDQAMYAAKSDGRNRVYSFSPLMAHNDQFWEYMRSSKGSFVDYRSYDSITGLPYLPQMLEIITDKNLQIQSMGVLVLSLKLEYDVEEFFGLKNITYDLENITTLIVKSCELIFPSDIYVGLSDIYNYEFIVLFPSVVDFSFNEQKFNQICIDICSTINEDLVHYTIELNYASSVLTPDSSNNRKLLSEIAAVRSRIVPFSSRKKNLETMLSFFPIRTKPFSLKKSVSLKEFCDSTTLQARYQYLSLNHPFEHNSILEAYLNNSINRKEELIYYIESITDSFGQDITLPLLVPCLKGISFLDYVSLLSCTIPCITKVLMINEYNLRQVPLNNYTDYLNELPENCILGLDNCYIGKEILNILSQFNFSIAVLSGNITRNLFLFKERIKIISGLKTFLDQIGMSMATREILSEEEYQIIKDLNIPLVSGEYINHRKEIMSP